MNFGHMFIDAGSFNLDLANRTGGEFRCGWGLLFDQYVNFGGFGKGTLFSFNNNSVSPRFISFNLMARRIAPEIDPEVLAYSDPAGQLQDGLIDEDY